MDTRRAMKKASTGKTSCPSNHSRPSASSTPALGRRQEWAKNRPPLFGADMPDELDEAHALLQS